MQDGAVVGRVIVAPIQVILTLIIVEHCAIVVPAYLRAVVGLGIPVLKAQGVEGQPFKGGVN